MKEEYLKLQDTIETFDARALQIKGWSVTVSLAGMAAALISDNVTLDLKGVAFFLSAMAALAFWLVEVSWKRFQWALAKRAHDIEEAFASGSVDIAPFQIGRTFDEQIDRWSWRTLRQPFKPFIMLPHALIAVLGFSLALAFWNAEPGQPIDWFGIELATAPPQSGAE